jgi:hypothetical protein
MEQDNQNIVSVNIETNNMIIVYENGEKETLSITPETYSRMHDKWLASQPPFISDLYKIQMRNIILASINNNQKCISDLNAYFSQGNEAEIMKFLTYMRKRDLTQEKSKWQTMS